MKGCVDLSGWLYAAIFYLPQAVTHPSINLTQCGVISLIGWNALPLCQATSPLATVTLYTAGLVNQMHYRMSFVHLQIADADRSWRQRSGAADRQQRPDRGQSVGNQVRAAPDPICQSCSADIQRDVCLRHGSAASAAAAATASQPTPAACDAHVILTRTTPKLMRRCGWWGRGPCRCGRPGDYEKHQRRLHTPRLLADDGVHLTLHGVKLYWRSIRGVILRHLDQLPDGTGI